MAIGRALLIGVALVVGGVSIGVWGLAGMWGTSGLTGAERPDAVVALPGEGTAPISTPALHEAEQGPGEPAVGHDREGEWFASVPVSAPAPSRASAQSRTNAGSREVVGKAKAPAVQRDRKPRTTAAAQGRKGGGREPVGRQLPHRARNPDPTGVIDADAQVIEAIFTR